MATQFFLDAPHNLDDLVTRVIDRHRGWWGRHVAARLSDTGDLHLFGRVTTYYQKQLAQEAFRHLHGIGRIQNELHVIGSLR
ncbi:MAG: BON domain-containing protein [Planctomycetaceae bacterium]|nr:BON domain-containing protein [Planctomycetaceae bacterium]